MNSTVAFRETVTSTDGSAEEGTCTEGNALTVLRTALRLRCTIEATRSGGVILVRNVWNGGVVPGRHTVTLEPVVPTGAITETVRSDLDAILELGRGKLLGNGRIAAGYIFAVPPAASARLIGRGLVSVDGTAVTVSLAGRLTMLAQDHRTTTSVPRGYHHQDGVIGPWRKGGCVYDGGSVARCACRWAYPADTRDGARRKAHEHRQEVTAALVQSLTKVLTPRINDGTI